MQTVRKLSILPALVVAIFVSLLFISGNAWGQWTTVESDNFNNFSTGFVQSGCSKQQYGAETGGTSDYCAYDKNVGASSGTYVGKFITLESGYTYRFSYYIKKANSASCKLTLKYGGADNGGTTVSSEFTPPTRGGTSAGDQYISDEITGDDNSYALKAVVTTGNSSDVKLRIDGFLVERKPIASSNPSIINIAHSPASPTSSDVVSVSADITDSDGIAGAEIHWGTSSGSLTNTINMSVSSGDTYVTDTDIPAQTAGTTIYYEVYALDNNSDETTSAEQSYTVVCPSVSAPIATAASSASGTSFTANWNAVSGATGYELDVYSLGSALVEMFTSIGGGASSSYLTRSWTGDGGTGWTAYKSRIDQVVNTGNDAICLKNEAGAYLISDEISGSISSIEFDVKQVYSGSGGQLTVKVLHGAGFADEITVGTISYSTTTSQFSESVSGVSGDYKIRIDNNTSARPVIDNLSYGSSTSYLTGYDPKDVGNVTSYGVSGLTAGETYYYVVRAYNDCGSESGDSNEITVNLSCSDPTTQASVLSFPDTQYDQMDIAWTNGDGDYRLVVASTSAITGIPSDNTTYIADAAFNNGQDELNAGEYVVYAGSGNSFTMTGLGSDTEYFIKIFEYNCDGGSEQYLTASPLSGSETTLANIPAVTDFDVTCMTETTATVEWTNPGTGNWDGVAIAVRRGSNPPQVLSGFANPSALTVNTTFGNAGSEYGSSPDYSYAIYKGTGTSVTVTGLTQGEDYVFKAFSYYNDGYDNSVAVTTTSITGLDISEVSSASAAAANSEALIGWANPVCFDEILIVGKDGGSVTSTPLGDGSAYSADAAFSVGTDIGTDEYVVYKGTGTSVNVTGLTNDNTYYFTIFIRIGTEWSSGVEVFVTPADVTVLEGGDLAIISVNTQYLGTGSDDEWCFISFEDITEGTSIEFTDNGYERELEGLWGDTEGTVRLTRTSGGTIVAGTPICIQGAGNDNDDFTIRLCGADDDANWDVSSLNGAFSFDFNSSDQIWVFQNGSWDNPSGDHDADYTGNVVWGWTGTNWESAYNYASTSGSTLPTGAECFNTDLDGVSTSGKVAYTGDMTQVSQIEWILRINNPANWTNYTDNTDFYANSPDYANVCQNFPIGSGGFTDGKWTGQRNTDWFDCGNWESLVIPDETTDVLFDNDDCGNDIELLAGETAECNDLTLQGTGTYSLWGEADPTKTIEIFGNLTIKNDDLLVFDDFDAGTDDGTIILHGNWNNEAGADGFYEGNSTVEFVGSSAQSLISSSGSENYYNFTMDATSNLNFNFTDVTVDNVLTLTNGVLATGANLLHVDNTDVNAITGYTSASYINGNLRRSVAGVGVYDFPVGDASNFELGSVEVSSATALTYLDAHFASADLGDVNIAPLGLQIDGTPLVAALDAGYWQIEPNVGATVNYNIELNLSGAANAAPIAEQHAVIKRDDAVSDWELQGSHDNSTQSISGGVVTAKLSNLSAFSQFAIARSNQWVLAVELIDFKVQCETAGLMIGWTTASEENSDYFEIQYSSDAKSWTKIQKLPAFGTTNMRQEYQLLLEESPRVGYYRLVEIDMDGTRTVYESQYVNCLSGNDGVEITITPNPAADFAEVRALKTFADFYLVGIFDARGKVINILSWENPAEQPLKLNLHEFTSGVYSIRVYNESENHSYKLLVK